MQVKIRIGHLNVAWFFVLTKPLLTGTFSSPIPTVELVIATYRAPFRFPDFISLPYIQPVVDSAMAYLNQSYNKTINFRHSYALNPSLTDCATLRDETGYLLSRHVLEKERRDRDATILISWVCDDPVITNNLAREWNYLFVSSVVADKIASNRAISPTWITATITSLPNYAHLYMTLFTRFNWTSIFIMLDGRSQAGFAAIAEVLYGVLQTTPKFTVRRMTVNVNSNDSFPLQQFRTVSRILTFFGSGGILRNLLIQAAQENMTNGEYVYIAVQAFRDYSFGSYSWKYGDSFDNITRDAYRSVLLVGLTEEMDIHDVSLNKELDDWPKLTREKYNHTDRQYYKANALLVTLYSSFLLVGVVLNETLSLASSVNISDGAALATRFLDRYFLTQTGRTYIDETGQRRVDLAVSTINESTGEYQVALLQHGERWRWESVAPIQWLGGRVPLNEPVCGYLNDRDDCRELSLLSGNMIIGLGVATCAIIVGVLLVWRHLRNLILDDKWWQLISHELARSYKVTVLSRHLLRSVLDGDYARRQSSLGGPRASGESHNLSTAKILAVKHASQS